MSSGCRLEQLLAAATRGPARRARGNKSHLWHQPSWHAPLSEHRSVGATEGRKAMPPEVLGKARYKADGRAG